MIDDWFERFTNVALSHYCKAPCHYLGSFYLPLIPQSLQTLPTLTLRFEVRIEVWGTDQARRHFLLRQVDLVCGQKITSRSICPGFDPTPLFGEEANSHNGNWNNYIVPLNNPLFASWAKSSTGWNWKIDNMEEASPLWKIISQQRTAPVCVLFKYVKIPFRRIS